MKYTFSGNLILTLEILLLIFLPEFIFVCFNTSSVTVGLLLACVIVIMFNFRKFKINIELLLILMFILVFLHLISIIIYFKTGYIKPLLSLLPFYFMLIASYLLSKKFIKLSIFEIEKITFVILNTLFTVGFLSKFYDPSFCNYGLLNKPVFPISEPSHLALAINIFLIPYILVTNFKKGLFVLINASLLSFLLPSATLLISTLLTTLFFFLKKFIQKEIFYIIIFNNLFNLV
ncbi:hypothetical protein [Thermosulfurimonas marina]|nr:hypothetical protein [Thermosulfurimonas marina]